MINEDMRKSLRNAIGSLNHMVHGERIVIYHELEKVADNSDDDVVFAMELVLSPMRESIKRVERWIDTWSQAPMTEGELREQQDTLPAFMTKSFGWTHCEGVYAFHRRHTISSMCEELRLILKPYQVLERILQKALDKITFLNNMLRPLSGIHDSDLDRESDHMSESF